MATTKLFDTWTWKRTPPKPFDDSATVSTDVHSIYNKTSTPKSTLHAATLRAILAYMELELAPGTAKGALGTQNDFLIGEYPSNRPGEIHAAVFNKNNGKFYAGVFANGNAPTPYTLKETDGNSGSALFFALMPVFLQDSEFSEEYNNLLYAKGAGYSDMEKAEKSAYILCDNVYRRIENAAALGDKGIPVSIPKTGNIQAFTKINLDNNTYSPSSVILGTFEVIKAGAAPTSTAVFTKPEDFRGKYGLSGRSFSPAEADLIPKLPDWYVIPPEVVNICRHAQATTASSQPMRNFLLRGPAGTGKTEGARAIAAGYVDTPFVQAMCYGYVVELQERATHA